MGSIADWKKTAGELQKKAKVFDTYAAHQQQFDSAKTNLAKELDAVAGALIDVSNSNAPQTQTAHNKQENTSPQKTTNDALKVATASVTAMQDALTGDVSIDDISTVAKNADEGYDAAFQTARNLNPKAVDAFVATYQKKHPIIFEAGSQIKNNSSEILMAVSGISGWGGDYGTPEQAMNKINNNVRQIATGSATLALSLKSFTDTVYTALNKDSGWIDHYLKDGTNICTNLGGAAAGLTQAGVTGIGSFNSARNAIDALSHGNIASASGYASAAIGGLLKTGASLVTAGANFRQFGETWREDHKKEDPQEILDLHGQYDYPPPGDPNPNSLNLQDQTHGDNGGGDTKGENNTGEDDYSADLIHEINVILDGESAPGISMCKVNGVEYKLTGYTISQELLQPMMLSFSLEKEDKIETDKDVVFRDSTQLIGKSIEIKATSRKTSLDDGDATDAFNFKGVIIDVSASRTVASAQSASIMAASYDCLLQNAPHCRSFENLSLQEIVEAVIQPYKDIQAVVKPRFTEKIPYIVQYNQSDFAFIRMLAIRFGEWMYSTGTQLVFGEFTNLNSSIANLQYPGGSLMSYGLSQSMNAFSFNHLLNNYYAFGSDKEIVKKTGLPQADSCYNDWTERAYEASKQRFAQEQINALSSGGFDNQKDDEGADTITDYSIKIQAHGQKSRLMTVHGSSKLAMLNIGKTFVICDNAQNVSGQNSDVKQNALRIVGINHSFDYSQDYSNSFNAVPETCSYPGYSDANVFPIAPSQRATVVDNKDEQSLGRIRVQFPWQKVQDEKMITPWLRIAVPYAGNVKGHQFIPEIGEEVMVGFEMDNAERPFIIGALYNGGSGKPDDKWAAAGSESGSDNNIKAIRTRNGHTIEIHDKGENGYIRIYDNEKENYILTFSTDEKLIKLESTGNIELYAKNDIIMHAGNNIVASAGSDLFTSAGHDRTVVVGHNQTINVSKNEFIEIGQNKDEKVELSSQLSAMNIIMEATQKLSETSTTYQQVALKTSNITAVDAIDVKAKIVRIN